MKNLRNNRTIMYLLATVIAVVLILGAFVRCAFMIMDRFTEQLQQNLTDVNLQSSEALQSQINSCYELLNTITIQLEEAGESRHELLERFKSVANEFHLKRIGYIDKDGIEYATDVEGIDLSYRYFFKRSLSGEVYISDVVEDALSEDHDNAVVMTKPIYNANGEVDAVAGITYSADVLSDEIALKSFDGYGDNFVINQNGNVAVSSNTEIMPISTNISMTDLGVDDNQDGINSDFIMIIAKNEPANGKVWLKGEPYFYRIQPVVILDGHTTWYMMSVVPEEYLLARFDSVKNNLIRMMIFVLFITGATILVMRYLYLNQRNITYALAYLSPITEGPNLAKFFENMKGVKDKNGYIAYMNIEDFVHTSVATGIEKSNELIKKIWEIITDNLEKGEEACHDKADSFVLYIKAQNEAELRERLQKIRDVVYQAGRTMDIPWVFSKFGVAEISENDDVEKVYSKAEYTVYDIWGKKEIISFFSDEDHEKQALNKAIEENFDEAVRNNRLEVWFQPKFDINTCEMTGAEALVRWRKKDGSLLSPGIFIPLLESNGDIAVLDEYVFRRVCEKKREWKELGYKNGPVSINVSRATLYRKNIVDTYVEILNENKIDPEDVQIEVTETVVGGNENILKLLTQFREQGIRILMDDFGTGYSSLSTLNMRCFDTLKIDKSLVDKITDDYGRTLIHHTIEMGVDLGLSITVEGVEEEGQLKLLREMKCNDVQGYYFSKPLPVSDYVNLIGKVDMADS